MSTSAKPAAAAAANDVAAKSIILPKSFDSKLIRYNAPRQLDSGARSIFVTYGENKAQLLLQTPMMEAPFGISCWQDSGKYSLDLSFRGRETNDKLDVFFRKLEALDGQLVSDAMDNSLAWFKKKYPNEEVLRALYTPSIKYAKDRDTGEITDRFPPTFKTSLPQKDGQFQVKCYNSAQQPIDVADILAREDKGKGMRVQAIVQLSLWVAGGKFGGTWKVKQLQVNEATSLPSYAFIKDGDEDAAADEEDARMMVGMNAGMSGLRVAPCAPTPTPALAPTTRRADVVDDSSADEGGEGLDVKEEDA